MAEAVLETVKAGNRHHRYLSTYFVQQLLHIHRLLTEFVVQAEIEQGKFLLTHGHHRALEMFGSEQFIQQFLWQRFACFIVTGNKGQRLRLVTPVFQELARQFDGIPGHAINAAHRRHINLRQHMVQAMTKFMEQRGQFVVGQQCRFITNRRREITHQISHRQLDAAIGVTATDTAIIHPRPAAFFRPCV